MIPSHARTAASLLALLLLPAGLLAQQPPQRIGSSRGVLVGAQVGLDYSIDAVVLGAQSHLVLDPWGLLDLMPGFQVSPHRGITDWQFTADAAVMPTRGLYLGGGAAFRNTLYELEKGRETRTGYSLFLGIRPPPSPGEINVQIELRWTFVADIVRPRVVSIGANWPLLLWR